MDDRTGPLAAFGWDPDSAKRFDPDRADGCVPARVIWEQRDRYRAASARGELPAELSGKLRFACAAPSELPAVGDWVALRPSPDGGLGIVERVLPRKSFIARGAAGRAAREQVLAANVDTAFIVTTADRDFNPRRIERYLSIIWDGGVRPVLLVNKIDLRPDHPSLLADAGRAFPGLDILGISALRSAELDCLSSYLKPARTAVLLGSSGAGKSTLLNRLIGEEVQRLGAVRPADQRGRHTTSSRQMFVLPNGSLLIDTPGLRELRLWGAAAGLDRTFADIGALAPRCRFGDCSHVGEPGCAVLEALREGLLDRSHYDNYLKLRKEQDYQSRREDPAQKANAKRRWRSVKKDLRFIQKTKRGDE